jgi:diguanylate cyclase (GGDEF)-like protein
MMSALSEYSHREASAARQTLKHSLQGLLQEVIECRLLTAVFQPILDFGQKRFLGFEGLIRGPEGTSLAQPAQLFADARSAGCLEQLDTACHLAILTAFAAQQLPGKVFINVTPRSLHTSGFVVNLLGVLASLALSPTRVVLELTESEAITNYAATDTVLQALRTHGFQIAIDDLGSGYASLRLWSELRPDLIKVDQHFVQGIAADTTKRHFVSTMQALAEHTGSKLIVEGLENREDLQAVQALGVAYAQGYFIARPQPVPPDSLDFGLLETLQQPPAGAATLGSCSAYASNAATARKLLRYVSPVSPETDNEVVFHLFEEQSALEVLPVVDEAGKPVGIINRTMLIDRFARPFRREIYGRKKCTLFMDAKPLVVDINSSLQEVGRQLAKADAHCLIDGFVITEQGRYAGIGSGHRLMAEITEMQISAARYANPLTQLPGNVPINESIDLLLEQQRAFVACYFDINHFKPFNDNYGYRRGDEVIQLLGTILTECSDSTLDFVGHIGGDDFLVSFQSTDWEARCQRILAHFDERIRPFFTHDDLARNGMLAENRRGISTLTPLTSLSVGAVIATPGEYASHYEIAAAATIAKKQAKKQGNSSLFVERRHPKPVTEMVKQA